MYRVDRDGRAAALATFERAGVPTVARMKDGRLIAAHQHFPERNDNDFDKVAVRFSSDDGTSWTTARVIGLTGLPDGMRFPFDPTLVPLSDGRVRLYFTSLARGGPLGRPSMPGIYSAVSSDGLDFSVEPGRRFGIDGRPVIDSAVVLHDGVFHLFSPDNGVMFGPPAPGRPPRADERPNEGAGYHAISRDGLTFTRVDDVHVDGRRRWLGNAVSDGTNITFFGTGDFGVGMWMATSPDGKAWRLATASLAVAGADPGAVQARDGGWIIVVTGPPRPGTPSAERRGRV